MTKQLNLFAAIPAPFRVEVLYMPCADRAFFQNERPTSVRTLNLEVSPYELQAELTKIAAEVARDSSLPREGRTSRYLVRAFDQEGHLYASA